LRSATRGGVERLVSAAARISDWHLKNPGTGLGARGAATRWARWVGSARAREPFLSGREIGADEAVRIDPGGGRIFEPAG
jgi:enoyl-CoA hydratase/carnithine racemase